MVVLMEYEVLDFMSKGISISSVLENMELHLLYLFSLNSNMRGNVSKVTTNEIRRYIYPN